jgi:hypothetical protein
VSNLKPKDVEMKKASAVRGKTGKRTDEDQSKRFINTAREIEADETKEGADRAFKSVAKAKPQKKR